MNDVMVWIDRKGWRCLETDISGTWANANPWPGLFELLAGDFGKIGSLLLSPEWFLFARGDVAEGKRPDEEITEAWGLMPGKWHFTTATLGDHWYLAAVTMAQYQAMCKVAMRFPDWQWRLAPLELDKRTDQAAHRVAPPECIRNYFDKTGRLTHWDVSILDRLDQTGPNGPDIFKQLPVSRWLVFEVPAQTPTPKLRKWSDLLGNGPVLAAMASLV